MFFDFLNGHRRLVDPQHTSAFARRRADAAGEFGEVVGAAEDVVSFLPAFVVDSVIEFRDHIPQRATAMAEGHAAIHTAGCLLVQAFFVEAACEFLVVADPYGRVLFVGQRPCVF